MFYESFLINKEANGNDRKPIVKQPILMSRKLRGFLCYYLIWLGILYKQLSESDASEEKAITRTIAFDLSEEGSLRVRVFSAHTIGTVPIASNLGNASNRAIVMGMDTWKKETFSNFPTHAGSMQSDPNCFLKGFPFIMGRDSSKPLTKEKN